MKKIAMLAAATGLALVTAVSTATPSSADPAGAAFVGGVLGFMAGAAMASGAPVYYDDYPHRHHWRADAWRAHVAACEDDYGWRYNPRTDLVHMYGDVFPCDD